jgi:hypothetical protein
MGYDARWTDIRVWGRGGGYGSLRHLSPPNFGDLVHWRDTYEDVRDTYVFSIVIFHGFFVGKEAKGRPYMWVG